MMWRATKVNQQVNYGNCISEIERDGRDNVHALWPIHVSRVELLTDKESSKLFYRVRNNNGTHEDLPYEDVFHVPSFISDDGRWGKGVIRHARETIGKALATQR